MARNARFEQWIPCPLPRVFSFFSDPLNLPLLMPPELAAEVTGLDAVPAPGGAKAGAGSEVRLSVRLLPPLPLRTNWVARIVEFEPGHHFVDVQVRGPFRHWRHRHGFEAERRAGRDGTWVRDDLEYEVGLGALGELAARYVVGSRIESTFRRRQERLEAILCPA